MKYIFCIFGVMVLLLACNRTDKNSYLIKGTVDETFPDDSVFLSDEKNEILAMVPVKDGKFEIKGSVSEPTRAGIGPANGVGTMLILENGAVYVAHLTGARATITGGGELHRLVGYYDNSDEFYNVAMNLEKLEDEIMSQPDVDPDNLSPEDRTRLMEAEEAAIEAENRAMFKVIDDPKAAPLVKAFAIARSQDSERLTLEKRIVMLNRLNEEMGGNTFVTRLRKSYEDEIESEIAREKAKEALVEGVPLKDFGVKDAAGNTVKLSDIVARNKYTILEFWASWCQPCRAEIPNLKKAYEKYKSKGLEIFAVSLDEKAEAWLGAVEKENTPWLNYHDPAHFNGEAARLYAVDAIPASFLFSRDGKLVVAEEGALRGPNLEETLAEFFE